MAELANSQKFKTVTTNMGRNAVALAHATGTSVKVTHIAVGDGSGNPIEPNAAMTELVHEVFRGTVNDVVILEDRPGQFTAELIIPQNTGGFFIREVGLFLEDGTLFAVGSTPLTEKPDLSSGAASDLIIRMIIRILDAGLIEILVDPAQVLVTRDLLERRLKEHDQNKDAHVQAFGLHNGDEEAHSTLLSPIKQSISDSQGSITDLEAIIRDAQKRNQIGAVLISDYALLKNGYNELMESGFYYFSESTSQDKPNRPCLPNGNSIGAHLLIVTKFSVKGNESQFYVKQTAYNTQSNVCVTRVRNTGGEWTDWVLAGQALPIATKSTTGEWSFIVTPRKPVFIYYFGNGVVDIDGYKFGKGYSKYFIDYSTSNTLTVQINSMPESGMLTAYQ